MNEYTEIIGKQIAFSLLEKPKTKKEIFANYYPEKFNEKKICRYRCKKCGILLKNKPTCGEYSTNYRISKCPECGKKLFKKTGKIVKLDKIKMQKTGKKEDEIPIKPNFEEEEIIIKTLKKNNSIIGWYNKSKKIIDNLGYVKKIDNNHYDINFEDIINHIWIFIKSEYPFSSNLKIEEKSFHFNYLNPNFKSQLVKYISNESVRKKLFSIKKWKVLFDDNNFPFVSICGFLNFIFILYILKHREKLKKNNVHSDTFRTKLIEKVLESKLDKGNDTFKISDIEKIAKLTQRIEKISFETDENIYNELSKLYGIYFDFSFHAPANLQPFHELVENKINIGTTLKRNYIRMLDLFYFDINKKIENLFELSS